MICFVFGTSIRGNALKVIVITLVPFLRYPYMSFHADRAFPVCEMAQLTFWL